MVSSMKRSDRELIRVCAEHEANSRVFCVVQFINEKEH